MKGVYLPAQVTQLARIWRNVITVAHAKLVESRRRQAIVTTTTAIITDITTTTTIELEYLHDGIKELAMRMRISTIA